MAIVSLSQDAPRAFVAHAKIGWEADFDGSVDAHGVYTPVGARTWTQRHFELISPGTGGEDVLKAGFETFEPRFNNGTDTIWHP